jgi:hypothetical protein
LSCCTTGGKNAAGSTGRTRGCRPCRALDVELLDRLRELVERGVVVEVAGTNRMPSAELVPDLLAERRAGVLLDRVVHDLREVLVGPVAAGEADEGEARRQQAAVGQVVDAGISFLRARSPVTPKITSRTGRRCAGAAGRAGRAAGSRPPRA